MNFTGKVVLVTGASRGIGAAIAQAFAQEGALVVVNYLQNVAAAEAVVAQCKAAGGDAFAVQADVTSEADVARLIETALTEAGKIDVLVNNAFAPYSFNPERRALFWELAWADYQRQMSALSQFANMQQQEQAMRSADVAALESAGAAQQGQMQQQLNAAQQQFQNEQLYPKQQMDWLSTQVRGMAPITPQTTTQTGGSTGATYSASPLSQLATGLYTAKGLSSLG